MQRTCWLASHGACVVKRVNIALLLPARWNHNIKRCKVSQMLYCRFTRCWPLPFLLLRALKRSFSLKRAFTTLAVSKMCRSGTGSSKVAHVSSEWVHQSRNVTQESFLLLFWSLQQASAKDESNISVQGQNVYWMMTIVIFLYLKQLSS